MEEPTLYQILCSPDFLYCSWLGVESKKGASGVDGEWIGQFQRNVRGNIFSLSRELEEETYEPAPLRGVRIPKDTPGEFRKIGVPTLRDRIVFRGVNSLLQELWDWQFSNLSFGYRRKRGVRQAIKAVSRRTKKGKTWFVRGDIRGCFDTFDWEFLSAIIGHALPDEQMLRLIEKAIRVPIVEKGRIHTRHKGVPQGSPVSPILANLYLHIFDSTMMRHGYPVIRYGDDWIALVEDGERALDCFYKAVEVLEDLRISINEEKSGIGDLRQITIDFLGFRVSAAGAEAGPKAWRWLSKAMEDFATSNDPTVRGKALGALENIRSLYRKSSDIGSLADKVLRSSW